MKDRLLYVKSQPIPVGEAKISIFDRGFPEEMLFLTPCTVQQFDRTVVMGENGSTVLY